MECVHVGAIVWSGGGEGASSGRRHRAAAAWRIIEQAACHAGATASARRLGGTLHRDGARRCAMLVRA